MVLFAILAYDLQTTRRSGIAYPEALIHLAELSRLGLHFGFGLVGVSGLGFSGLG